MKRLFVTLCFSLLATVASAKVRAAATIQGQEPLAGGYVSSINASTHLIGIDNDQIFIDATAASIRGINGDGVFADIKPGMQIATVLLGPATAPGQPLAARIVQILKFPQGTLTGLLQSVDLTNQTFTVLGKVIKIDQYTIFQGSVPRLDPHDLTALAALLSSPDGAPTLTIDLNGDPAQLVAQRIYVIAPTPDRMVVFTAVLDHISGSTWFVRQSSQFTSFQVVSTTAITQVPAGDYIQVLARIDGDVVTAVAVGPAPRPCGTECGPVNPTYPIAGVLRERTDTKVVVDEGKNVYDIAVTSATAFDGNPQVNDNVIASVQVVDGVYRATRVAKVTGPLTMTIIDTVTVMNPNNWTVGPFNIVINDATQITGTIHLGDKVRILGDRQPNGNVIARVIDKP